jgi:signal transduction histidine kinase
MEWRRLAAVSAILVAALEVFVDWETWIQLNVSIVYGIPLVVAAGSRSRRLLWTLALALVAMTFVVYSRQVVPGGFSLREPFFLNRLLAACTLLIVAGLLHALIAAIQALEAKRRQAEEASSRKTQMLASVSHDIRTPLTAINLIADVIRRTADNPALAVQIPGLAQEVQTSVASLAELVTDVLDIAQMDSGSVQLHLAEFSIDELVTEECRRLRPLAEAKALHLAHEAATGLRLRADRVKLARVLRNLVTNAIQYTAAGSITVGCSVSASGEPMLRVRDSGIGIAPEHRESIFGEFARLPEAHSHNARGWGLGLAICRRLALLMGCRIIVESAPGEGSTFTVVLPAEALSSAARERRSTVAAV